MNKILFYYLLCVNVVSFVVFGIDKLKAKHKKWRIPESSLLCLAAVGGSIGAWLGMVIWHHKTLHKKFRFGIPMIFILQIAILLLFKYVDFQ